MTGRALIPPPYIKCIKATQLCARHFPGFHLLGSPVPSSQASPVYAPSPLLSRFQDGWVGNQERRIRSETRLRVLKLGLLPDCTSKVLSNWALFVLMASRLASQVGKVLE